MIFEMIKKNVLLISEYFNFIKALLNINSP